MSYAFRATMKINVDGDFHVQQGKWACTPFIRDDNGVTLTAGGLSPLRDTEICQSSDLSRGCTFGSEVTKMRLCSESTPSTQKNVNLVL
jgi:hypothetical protein